MDGKANDFLIDDAGDLVMLPDQPEHSGALVRVLDEGTVLAMVLQGSNGEVAIQVFGTPSKELVAALFAAVRGLMQVLESKDPPEPCN